MASVAVDKLNPTEKEQLAISYAAFVLSGQGAEVNADSLSAVLKAANVEVSKNLISTMAKTLKARNVSEFYGAVGGGSAPAASSTPTPAAADKAPIKEAPKEEAPPAEEEEDMDMGGLFD